ncbi:hypothetical protein IQ06DRAFT_68332 [Phaeosphaeriaceae sp. SRC1lsM3a]|nr:hypothetical protein IQ06DRAFT_68332 [Stagonospora sp. SRC1lsM3a]
MSAVSYKLPSPPESVFAKKFQDRVLESTGIELPKRRSAKSRVRQRKPHDFIHPIEKAHNPLFAYFQKEAERKEDAKCVFLLWGSRNSESSPTWAVDVQVTGIEDEAKIFQRLAQRYSAEQGFLQRYFSFREYDRLEPVTFRLIWQASGKFSVFMESLDLAGCRVECLRLQETAQTEISKMADFDSGDPFPVFCFRDQSGQYEHDNGGCPLNSSSDLIHRACPFESWDTCNDQLRWIDTANLISCYFRQPASASAQQILHGFKDHCFVHYYRNIRRPPNSFQPQNRDLSLEGLYLRTRLNISKGIFVCVGLILLTILGGKLIWNSWEIVFGAGSFIVAIPMLAMTAITFFDA